MAVHFPGENRWEDALQRLAPDFFSPRLELDRTLDRLRLALLLGSTSDVPIAPVPTWTLIPDPFRFPSFQPNPEPRGKPTRRIEPADVSSLEAWMNAVNEKFDPKLDLATRRLLSALTRRTSPEDGLVDAMIALESMFGTGRGEIRFRLSVALSWLLESDLVSRERRQKEVNSLYDSRSKIVHGGHMESVKAEEARIRAVALTIDAMRKLFSARPDLIADDDRGRTLAVGG